MWQFFGWYPLHKWATDNEHNHRLRDRLAVAIALGMVGVLLDTLFLVDTRFSHNRFLLGFWGLLALPGLVLLCWRLVRPLSGRAAIPTGRCTFCRREAETTPIRFLSVVGLLLVFVLQERTGFACRRCAWRQFFIMTGATLLLGWWSIFSLFIVQGFVIQNVLLLVRALVVRGPSSYAQRQAFRILDERRDYARALAATKPSETAVDVLEQTSEVPRAFVAAYVASLSPGASAAHPIAADFPRARIVPRGNRIQTPVDSG